MSDDNVKKLPVRFKGPLPEDRTVMLAWEAGKSGGCQHTMTQYIVGGVGETEVECGRCGAKLNPMWVLMEIATADRRYQEAAARHKDEMRRLSERTRTKCEHCKQMTRISRR